MEPSASVDSALERLNAATYEELRALGLSFEETGQILTYRERPGGFRRIEELEHVPALSVEAIAALKASADGTREAPAAVDGDGAGASGDDFRWRDRPADAGRTRRLVKYRVAYGGAWRARFETLAEALDYAEGKAPRVRDDIVYVIRSSMWRKQLVTAYPQSSVAAARSLWRQSRRVAGGGGG